MTILVEVQDWDLDYKQSVEPNSPVFGTTWLDTSNWKYKIYTGSEWIEFSSDLTGPGDIGIFGGGYDASLIEYNTIDQVTISSPGNATDFGDLTVGKKSIGSTSNGINDTGVFGGDSSTTMVDKVTISSPGNASDLIDPITQELNGYSMTSNGSGDMALIIGGEISKAESRVHKIFNISTGTYANDIGDLNIKCKDNASTSNGINDIALCAHGINDSGDVVNSIDYFTISSIYINAVDFGDLIQSRGNLSATSNGTNDIGIFSGGGNDAGNIFNTIDQVTISSPGNATDFGDLSVVRNNLSATSNGINDIGIFGGGYNTSSNQFNTIEQITISSPGNATDFGDLTIARHSLGSTSNGLL